MGIMSLASSASAYRGYLYYRDKMVVKVKATGENSYEGGVNGRNWRRPS